MIDIENVSFNYEGTNKGSLNNINLQIHDGEFVLLCGKSGCGKSTMLRLLNGLIPHYYPGEFSGKVLLEGVDSSQLEMYEIAQKVGTVFQNPRTQFFNVSTDAEIVFGIENLSLPRAEIEKRLEKTTKDLEIEKLRDRSIFELSGGEKQKIAFAGIYAMNPDVFTLDEPSSNLDHAAIETLRKQLEFIKKQGKTIVVAEHRIYYLWDMADKIIYIDDGCIKGVYTPKEFAVISDEERRKMGLRNIKKEEVCLDESHYSKDANINDNLTLVVRNLIVKRKKRVLLKDLNFTIKEGEILGITAPNGTGKSTLLRTLCGIHKEYSGEIFFEINTDAESKKIKAQKNAYMIMQDVNYELFANSVENECRLGLKNVKSDVIDETLQLLSLEKFKNKHPNTLSGGQKQRVAIAVSRICGKKLLVFDEPTSGLDYESMCQVSNLLKKLSRNAIVIVVTHDNEFINRACTQVLDLERYTLSEDC